MSQVVPLANNTSHNINRTNVPAQLDDVPKEELIRLLKRVAHERDELILLEEEQARKKVKVTPPKTAAVKPVSFNAEATKKRIASNTLKAVKKTAHNQRKKPWTEIHESLPSYECLTQLMEGYKPVSETSRLIKYELRDGEVHRWLGCEAIIPKCKFDGYCLVFRGEKMPDIKTDAAFEKVEIKYDRKQGQLSLKFRTYMYERPLHEKLSLAMDGSY
jgi:hypothetical protein